MGVFVEGIGVLVHVAVAEGVKLGVSVAVRLGVTVLLDVGKGRKGVTVDEAGVREVLWVFTVVLRIGAPAKFSAARMIAVSSSASTKIISMIKKGGFEVDRVGGKRSTDWMS